MSKPSHPNRVAWLRRAPTNAPARSGIRVGAAAGALIAAAIGYAVRAPADEKFMKVEDVKPGMKGYGLTVMHGTRPEKFDVEVISTMTNFRPKQDLILIKTHHPRLDVARIVAGMSGSPIYIDGKLVGAYAYGWLYGIEPIAGVTPIHNMLADLRRPIPPALAPAVGHAPLPAPLNGPQRHGQNEIDRPNRFAGAPLDYDLREHGKQLAQHNRVALAAPEGSGLAAATTDLMIAGMGPKTAKLAVDLLEPLGMTVMQGGGAGGKPQTAPGDPTRFIDGGVLTVQLVRGDLSITGLGTVTYVAGDKLLGFGHPMMEGGLEELPTALGQVHWVLASYQRSFKLGEPTVPLGALVSDRQADIIVDQTRTAPTFPVKVEVDGAPGAPYTHWSMEGTSDQFLAPSAAALAIGSALEATASERGETTWRAKSRLMIDGGTVLTLEDFGAGSGSPLGPGDFIRSRLVRAMGALLNNPWRMGHIDSVDTKVDIVMRREVMILRGAQLLDSEVEPGGKARVVLTLQNYLGDRQTQQIEIPIAPSLRGQTARIEIRPAYLVDRAVAAPENYAQLVDVLGKMDMPAEAIVASYALPDEATATFNGHVIDRMPPGLTSMMSTRMSSVSPDFYAAQQQIVIPMKGFMVGQESVEVQVREVLK